MAKRKESKPSEAPPLSPRKTRSASRKLAAPAPEEPARKKAKVAKGKGKAVNDAPPAEQVPPAADGGDISSSSKTVIIEACKQCQSFNRTAVRVKDGLEKQMPNINVVINPDKPRRGCFEVRGDNGDIFISLLDMKRPFQPMKDLNLLEVVTNIGEKLK